MGRRIVCVHVLSVCLCVYVSVCVSLRVSLCRRFVYVYLASRSSPLLSSPLLYYLHALLMLTSNPHAIRSMLYKFREANLMDLGLARSRARPWNPDECKHVSQAESWRADLVSEITQKIARIQEGTCAVVVVVVVVVVVKVTMFLLFRPRYLLHALPSLSTLSLVPLFPPPPSQYHLRSLHHRVPDP